MADDRELTGVHHLRLPVRQLEQSFAFWHELLGYERDFDFAGPEGPRGWALTHPRGGPDLVLWHDPAKAEAGSGFPWFSVGLPSPEGIHSLARELDRRDVRHGGVQDGLVGIKLPFVNDPDGHLIGFYVKPRNP
jgi:catechol 2,3-dioxygenase-like lactoylglutathione lyase family enzyme